MPVEHNRKVVVVGAGAVGSTFCYALAQSGLADDIALVDKNETLARGQVLDLAHGKPFFPSVSLREGSPADYREARLIVITAGAKQRPGQSRLELVQTNAGIVRSIVSDVVAQESRAVILVVSNPVDVMTYVALRAAGGRRGRVVGSGTVLDSARFRYLLSAHCGVDIHNVHAYILGEHGDSEFAAWSMTHVAGIHLDAFCPLCGKCADWAQTRREIEQEVKHSAYHIIDYKGPTCFAVGLALVRIAGAVLRGESSVLTVSTRLDGEFGLRDVCLSVPCLVSGGGVEKILPGELSKSETKALHASAEVLRKAIAQLAPGDGRGPAGRRKNRTPGKPF